MTPGGMLLEARHVTQRFRLPNGQVLEALRDVSLAVREHEVVALVGPSGCGKSTLLYLLGLLDQPDEGQIEINGRMMSNSEPSSARIYPSLTTGGLGSCGSRALPASTRPRVFG